MNKNLSVLICMANGTEEIESVTVINLLVRAGISVSIASVNSDGDRKIVCSRGVRILSDVRLLDVVDNNYSAIVLPGGMKGAERFRDSSLLIETIRKFYLSKRIVASICASTGIVLMSHNLFPTGKMTGFPGLKSLIPADQWVEKHVVWDQRVNLLTSQGPGTAIYFTLKLIELLAGKEKAENVASQLVLSNRIKTADINYNELVK